MNGSNTMTKISIIMPAYNSEHFIRKALSSIPYDDDIEVIVINDASTDNTRSIAEEFNAIIIDHKENMGIGYSRHEALEIAKGEYIMFFDSDDEIIKDNFLKAKEMLDGSDIIYYDLKQNDGVVLHLTPETKGIYPGADKFLRREYIKQFDYPTIRKYEDVKFNGMIHAVPHTDRYTNLIVVNYNFPRYDSTSAKWGRGEL